MAADTEFGLDVGVYGRLARPDEVLKLALLAETEGFQSVWLADHVVFPAAVTSKYPYSVDGEFPVPLDEPLLEPIATMGVLVGATKRVKIGTAVLVMPYRNPILLARMLATLDVFSNGRIILGAGVGWMAEEFAALGAFDFAKRGKVTDEYLEIFKAICAGGEVAYQGETYQFDPVHSYPASVQRPHPPILVGGTSKAALRRVVRLADGWLSVGLGIAALAERLTALRGFCQDEGRSFDDLSLHHKLFINIDNAVAAKDGGREPGTGSVGQIIDDFRRIRDLGYSGFIVRYRGDDAAEQQRQISRFAAEIAPKVF
ncbi:MAG: TIGR03619 family F420-dependent LLM class oxidoreductase [Rhodospirillaceae bacterium]|jgi:probable F420-dependent oxidoreductase|nr:TIGR03619 family F420-dependent LLM class oxidoreductase [Rhodospirillaceae bacterium]MBT3491152.1 TIGR03619 family F420-dependent LLM class oxidoreductase [Rhodospirillaceae bacterium]MBT3781225.1 TIGR03619 family F420-dependent LLM class oxidoreductase [Rhodospirillaceae bacterium]MBT3979455.1 TIGR03619 family F420-dependent LLM class oxidoreductase [Rhodospirillaceae bacterium]MBT4167950.1 TIGR03619 family F420-dependent LLM class oxidoreductase [Rhodospirillaceae bacterium]